MIATQIRITALIGLIVATSATAQIITPESRYRDCLALAQKDGPAGFGMANTWLDEGGGVYARHCLALSLITMGKPEPAAGMLDALAGDLERDRPELVPDVLAQAAQAWVGAGDPARALKDLDRAITLKPRDAELLVDRAALKGEQSQHQEALRDLDAALAIEPRNLAALVYRGAAHRALSQFDQAAKDLDNAVQIAPDDPQARLERGILRSTTGDPKGARADWLALLQRHPDTAEAQTARARLEAMDVKP